MAAVFVVTHSKHLALFAVIAFLFIIAVTDGCNYDMDCPDLINQVCCNGECVYDSSCIGRYCTSDSNCSSDESCCSSVCTFGNCLGSTCSNDTDCGVLERCCYGTCQDSYDECNKPLSSGERAGAIVGAVLGSFIFGCLFVACIRGLCSGSNERTHSRITTPVIVTNTRRVAQTTPPQRATATIYTRRVVQRFYQQGYPYHPPPQQTTNRPPKIDNTLAVSRRPPPYTATQQERPGGVYAPQTSYGSVQSAQVV